MLQRALTVVLAFVLFWSALATQERPLLVVDGHDAVEIHAMVSGENSPRGDGSVDDHHLDDQPGQASFEHVPDLPAWFPATRPAAALSPGGRSFTEQVVLAPVANVPDVPQRPPCA